MLKEKNLEQTLTILRSELTKHYQELNAQREQREEQREEVYRSLTQTMRQSNQNALMLYSQDQEYLFDLTYACHQATELYQDFQRRQMPFREYIVNTSGEIARYDSLVTSLKNMPVNMLSDKARIDRSVCLTLATSIMRTLTDASQQMEDYIRYYDMTESRLKNMNDYAQKRYYDIQTSIFVNGGDTYIGIVRHLKQKWQTMQEVVGKKYSINQENRHSDWNIYWIIGLFCAILFYALIAIGLNLLAFRFMPRRLHTPEFLKKRSSIIWATTTITLAILMGLLRHNSSQNFFIMASGLLVEYLWLLAVILISLLLRVNGSQIKSAFHIYAPLLVIGLVVITFRIVLIPNDLVNLIFPPILLLCTVWQWSVIRRHGKRIPRSDVFYSYISLVIFMVSTVSSWVGYTLLSVQLLIWWIMQLACILTITCFTSWMKNYSQRHQIASKPVTKTWFFHLVYEVLLPVMALLSIPLSIYMAADVFNLSELTWHIFTRPFVNLKNLRVSLFSIIQVLELYFFFKYLNKICLDLLHVHFRRKNLDNVGSREVMGKNVTQVLVWGMWLLISLTILHVGGTWLGYIAGGLSTGVGFASKDILENLYYGINLMAGRIKVGDWIECDGVKGKVASISYTSTMLEAIDGSVIAFTNSQLFTKNYKNLTKNHGYVLSLIPFGVAYGSKMKDVMALIEEAVMSMHHPYLDPYKQVKVVFTEFGDSSINFKLLCWVDAIKQIYAVSDVMKCIYDTLNTNGIEIPFPQRDVHLKDALTGRSV